MGIIHVRVVLSPFSTNHERSVTKILTAIPVSRQETFTVCHFSTLSGYDQGESVWCMLRKLGICYGLPTASRAGRANRLSMSFPSQKYWSKPARRTIQHPRLWTLKICWHIHWSIAHTKKAEPSTKIFLPGGLTNNPNTILIRCRRFVGVCIWLYIGLVVFISISCKILAPFGIEHFAIEYECLYFGRWVVCEFVLNNTYISLNLNWVN